MTGSLPRVRESVRDEVVEHLSKAYRVRVQDDRAIDLLSHHVRATHGERCDDIACESRDVDWLRAHRVDRDVHDDPLDRPRGSDREPYELARCVRSTDVSVTATSATADNAATGLRTSCTSSASRACSKSEVTLPAQPTVERPARAVAEDRVVVVRVPVMLGTSAELPTLLAATSALRLSQRGSLRDVETVVLLDELGALTIEPVRERHDPVGAVARHLPDAVSRHRDSRGTPPGRCRSHRPSHRVRCGTPLESERAPASSTRGTS